MGGSITELQHAYWKSRNMLLSYGNENQSKPVDSASPSPNLPVELSNTFFLVYSQYYQPLLMAMLYLSQLNHIYHFQQPGLFCSNSPTGLSWL